MQKIVVVTYSQAGTDWVSLGEVIPCLERIWSLVRAPDLQVKFYDVSRDSLQDHLRDFWEASKIVFLSLLPYKKMSALIQWLRRDLALPCPFIIHFYDNATMGAWRLHVMKIGPLLRKDDLFITSSSADARLMKYCYQGAQKVTIPFSPAVPFPLGKEKNQDIIPLVYIGRISEQKMLHLLLVALWLLKRDRRKVRRKYHLQLFGAGDGLGSPNMGIRFKNYEAYLNLLTEQLDLLGEVTFKGFVPASRLYREELPCPHIFVSPGLHSDENFGVAAYRSLRAGHQAVLTEWGGHRDFKKYFPSQVQGVKVYGSPCGPVISPLELARALARGMKRFGEGKATSPSYYEEKNLVNQYRALALKKGISKGLLPITPLAQKILRQRKKIFASWPSGMTLEEKEFYYNKIFHHYGDPLCRPFFKGYGMRDAYLPGKGKGKGRFLPLIILPWVQVRRGKVTIEDPHKGEFVREFSPHFSQEGKVTVVQDVFSQSHLLPAGVARWLVRRGYALREMR